MLTLQCFRWRNQQVPTRVGVLQVDALGVVRGLVRTTKGTLVDPPRPLTEAELRLLLPVEGGSLVPLDTATEALRAEVAALRQEVAELRSAWPNGSQTEPQRAAERRVGQPLEAFFAARAGASVGDLARTLGVSKSTCHAWRQQFGPDG
jgi:hypothetical protein